MYELAKEYKENKLLIEQLEELNQKIKSQICDLMGENDTKIVKEIKITNKIITCSRLNSNLLKTEQPEIFDKYSNDYTYKRFVVRWQMFILTFLIIFPFVLLAEILKQNK